jgi:hypothetical protein
MWIHLFTCFLLYENVSTTCFERHILTLFDAMTSSNQRGENFRISTGFGSLASSSSRFTFSRKLTAIFWYVLPVFILQAKHPKAAYQESHPLMYECVLITL